MTFQNENLALTLGTSPQQVAVALLAAPRQPRIPFLNLHYWVNSVQHPDNEHLLPSTENQINEMPIFELPTLGSYEAALIPDEITISDVSPSGGVVPEMDEGEPSTEYLRELRRQITTDWDPEALPYENISS